MLQKGVPGRPRNAMPCHRAGHDGHNITHASKPSYIKTEKKRQTKEGKETKREKKGGENTKKRDIEKKKRNITGSRYPDK